MDHDTDYGMELILDLHGCQPSAFTRGSVATWFSSVCEMTGMEAREQHWWEEYGHDEPHLNGITAVQFISTSSITIHASEHRRGARINVFTCKRFDPEAVSEFTLRWFGGEIAQQVVVSRR